MGLLHILRIALTSALFFAFASGRCTNPRVRKEWRSLCSDERAAWIKAVKCLANLPHDPHVTTLVDPALSKIPPLNPNSSYFDDFVWMHMDLNVLIHQTGFFLPWHRQYVWTFEEALRSKCGYDGAQPYWNWTLDTADFYHSPVFSDSEYDGIGTWGDPSNDYQIYDGGLKDIVVAYPVPHHIRRNFTVQPFIDGPFLAPNGPPLPYFALKMNTTFTKDIVEALVDGFAGDYFGFQATLENFRGPHPGVHGIFGGDMAGRCPFGLGPSQCVPGQKWAPNDPVFFFHHAMLDKVWYDWQNRDPSNKNIFTGGTVSWQASPDVFFVRYPIGAPPLLNMSSVLPNDGLWYDDVRVSDVFDTLGGNLCYTYE